MSQRLKSFLGNVALLSGATFLAQLIPIAISPLLTRLFTPEDFGHSASYLAIAGVLGIIATGRFETAILLPRSDGVARVIATVVIWMGIGLAVMTLLVVLIFSQFALWHGLDPTAVDPLYLLLPLSVLLTSVYAALLHWTNRQSRFDTIATNRLVQAASSGAVQSAGGFAGAGPIGIVFGVIAGQIMSISLFSHHARNMVRSALRPPSRTHWRYVMVRYWRFPTLDAPAALLIVLSSQFPNVLLATNFSPAAAGFFFLTQRVLQAPVTLIASSFLEVFRHRASRDRAVNGTMRPVFLQTLTALLAISVPISLFLYFTIDDLFVFAFGEEWREAGVYATYLVPAMGFRLIANPLSFTLNLVGWQVVNLVGSIFLAGMSLAAILFADSARDAVMLLSIVFSFVYFTYIILSIVASKK